MNMKRMARSAGEWAGLVAVFAAMVMVILFAILWPLAKMAAVGYVLLKAAGCG
jgi:hypothetical protein